MTKTQYAMQELDKVRGVKTPLFEAPHFKEFTVNFDKTGKNVRFLHQALLKKYGVHGGKDISKEFPELGQTALYCVSEVHSKIDLDKLVLALKKTLSGRKVRSCVSTGALG